MIHSLPTSPRGTGVQLYPTPQFSHTPILARDSFFVSIYAGQRLAGHSGDHLEIPRETTPHLYPCTPVPLPGTHHEEIPAMSTTTFADTIHAARILNKLLVLRDQITRILARLEDDK